MINRSPVGKPDGAVAPITGGPGGTPPIRAFFTAPRTRAASASRRVTRGPAAGAGSPAGPRCFSPRGAGGERGRVITPHGRRGGPRLGPGGPAEEPKSGPP